MLDALAGGFEQKVTRYFDGLTHEKIVRIGMADNAGFGSLRRFNSAFQQTYGRAPRDLRRQRYQGLREQNEVVLRLAFRPPYDWNQVQDFLAARAVRGVERVDDRGYARTVALGAGHGIICVRPVEGEEALELRVRNAAPAALLQITSSVRRTFDLSADPGQIALAFRSDPLLAPLIKRRAGLRIPGAWEPFECAVRAVLGQEVSVVVGRTLATRLVVRIGRKIVDAEDGLTHLFPTPADLAVANLDDLGLTKPRGRAVQTLARAVADGNLPFDGPPEEVARALAALPGIGVWKAQYIALRALFEPDAFPASDLVLRRTAARGSAALSVRSLEACAETWRPWRGYAAGHLWREAADAECKRNAA